MATTKRKTTTAVVAGVATAAILLGGTFAWTSISQQAKNEAIVDINPGGRLHDDFNGTNKDVYVENFSSGVTGVDIFARVRLDQYIEVGPDAGKNLTVEMTERNVKTLIGEDSDGLDTWVTYVPSDTIEDGTVQANDYWTWTLGNDEDDLPYYMPTFNKNKDSLAADINGTWQGIVEGDIVYYDDYILYNEGSTVIATEVYDHDSNTEEEPEGTATDAPVYSTTDINTPIDDAHVYLNENVEHTATQISSGATVITMQQWIDDYSSELGDYWVYDADGWAYWANPIAPGETTGLLLNGVTMSRVPDENWYFGINVVGEFATAGDIYEFSDMSEEAQALVERLTGTVSDDEDDEEMESNLTVDGQSANENGYIYLSGLDIEQSNSFDVVVNKDSVTLAENGLTAKLDDSNITGTEFTVDVDDPYKATLTIASHDNNTVEITATYDDGTSETVIVVPIYSTIVITPDMNGETLYLDSSYYTLQAEDFTGTVTYEFSGANRSLQEERDGAQMLFISSYESGENITLTASDGTDSATVNVVIVNSHPYDGPIYAYYVQGSGLAFSNALVEGQDYYWNQGDGLSYELSVGMTNDFAENGGQVAITLDGVQTAEDGTLAAGFISEDGTLVATASGQNPAGIRVTEAQTLPFTIKVDITGIDTDKYETGEYHHEIYIYPVPGDIDSLRHVIMRSDDTTYDNDGEILPIGPGESKEVNLHASYIYGITETNPLTNDDLTWTVSTENGNYEIAEGDESGLTATVSHQCTDADTCNCSRGGKVQVQITGMDYNIVSDFTLSPESYTEEGGNDGEEESTLAMTFNSDPEYTEDGNGGAYIEIDKVRTAEIEWNLYGCSAGNFNLTCDNSDVTVKPWDDEDNNLNSDMVVVIPTTVTEDFTVTATSIDDSGKSVIFTVKMVDSDSEV